MFLGRIMNSNEASSFFPSCGSYDPHHQPWGWRQESCYPYYSETMPPINHHLPSLPPDVGRNSCAATNPDCRLNDGQIGYGVDSNGAGGAGNHLRGEDSHQDHSNDRYVEKSEIAVETQPTGAKQTDVASGSDCSGNKKKRDRFNGMTEEDVLKRTVPDLLAPNLDIIIIGSCPGLTAAYLGHHYAGPGNHFWKCLYLSGLIPEPMNANDDYKLKQYGIGFTNFVARCTKGSVEFSRREIKEGVESLTEKIQTYKPKIAVFNGKGIYEVFCNHKNFYIGKQPEPFPGTNTVVYVMPSSSARCSQLPRASDKVPFFIALRKLRDHLHGCLPHLDESEVVFPDLDLKVEPRKDRRPVEENHTTQESTSASAAHSSIAASVAAAADKDRKRKHVDCNFNAVSMAVHDRPSYHHGLPPSFAAMSQDIAPEFKWNSGFQKWPPALGIPHSSPLVGMSPRTDCNYDALLAKQEDAAGQVLNPCSLLRGLPSAPFYAGWSDSQHRWTMNGLATRFNNDTRYPVNIPTYLQYPDMISCADRLSSHLSAAAEPTYRPMYPNLSAYPQDAFLSSSGTATSSAFSYNSSLSRDIKPGTTQFDPVFFQRPSYSPPSYYHQYR